MAIYKPTNCSPYLTTFDSRVEAGSPQFFECRVDSSNKNADGYSIILYDEDNEQVFPVTNVNGTGPNTTWTNVAQDENITFVSDLTAITGNGIRSADEYYYIQSAGYTNLNTGLNGSYLRIPFFMNVNDAEEFISCNTIYVDTSGSSPAYYALTEAGASATPQGTKWGEINNDYKVNLTQLIQNGYSFKWAITLYQGQKAGNKIKIPPEDIKYYDMTLTTGQTLGSYMERIQSVLSDEIYIDYYVQPVYISDLSVENDADGNWDPTNWTGGTITNVGNRARIKNYDSTYGHIYPQVGDSGLTDGSIDQSATPGSTVANGFQIYSMSNNEDDLATTRKVWAAFNNYTIPFDWENYISDASQSQGQQHIYVLYNEDDTITIPLGDRFNLTIPSGVGGSMSSSRFFPFEVTLVPLTFEGESAEQRVWVLTSRNTAISSSVRIILNHQAPSTSTWYTGNGDDPERSFIIPSDFESGSNLADLANYLTNYSGSAYNGIFVPSLSGGEAVTANGHQWRHYVVTWARPSDADTWGEISNKVVMVTETANNMGFFGGSNVQIDWTGDTPETAVGTINETDILFINEKPLEIYSYTGSANPDINTTGIIFYNQEETENTAGRLFIRPFTGIARGMYWQETGPVRSAKRQFIIDSVNTDYWYITYRTAGTYNTGGQETDMVNDLIPLDTRYQIKSFFRAGDENPFDLEDSPELTISLYYDSDKEQNAIEEYTGGDQPIPIIKQRSVWAFAEYSQDNYVSWKSYQWFLYEGRGASGQILQSGDIEYDGEPSHRFYGFLDGHYYTIVLYMETASGTTVSRTQYIYVQFQETTLDLPLVYEYECDTHSVSLSFSNAGFIMPNAIYTSEEQSYSRYQSEENPNDSTPAIGGVSYDTENGVMEISSSVQNLSANPVSLPLGGVEYAYVSSDVNENNIVTPIVVEGNVVSFQTRIRLANTDYEGDIIGVQAGEEDVSAGYDCDFSIYIPDMTENVSFAHGYSEDSFTMSSGEEYQMRYRLSRNNSLIEDMPVTIQRNDGTVSEDGIWWNYYNNDGLRVRPTIISGWQNYNYTVPSNSYSRLISDIDSVCMVVENEGVYTATITPTSDYPYAESHYLYNLIGTSNISIKFPVQDNTLYWGFEVQPDLDAEDVADREGGQFMASDGEEFFVKGGVDQSFWSDYEQTIIRTARNAGYVVSDGETETFTIPSSNDLLYRNVINVTVPQYWNDQTVSGDDRYWVDSDSYNGSGYPTIPNVITQSQKGGGISVIHPEIINYTFSFAANLENFSIDGGVPNITLAVYEEDSN